MGQALTFGRGERLSRLRSVKNRLRNWRDEIWDRRLGVSTFGMLPAVGTEADPNWQVHYEPARYGDLFKMLQFCKVGRSDVFLDLGCGLGRAVFAARHLGVRQAFGVEINRGLHERSLANLSSARDSGDGAQFFCLPAQEFTDSTTTIVYLFNPFGVGTLGEVVRKLGQSLQAHPRRIQLIYFNPLFDHVLAEAGFLRLVEQWPGNTEVEQKYCKYKVSFWETISR